MTIEGPRMMDKTLHGAYLTTNESGIVTIADGEWIMLVPYYAVQRSYFDLSGYTKPSLTTFFQGVDFQYAAPPQSDDGHIQVYDFITTEFLSDAELINSLTANISSGPGFSPSTLNMEQIIYARRRSYAWPGILPAPGDPSIPIHAVDLWGTCNATTADKLHITRVCVFGDGGKFANIPDVNVVVTAIIAKEKELPYLMRQKRSYELSTGS